MAATHKSQRLAPDTGTQSAVPQQRERPRGQSAQVPHAPTGGAASEIQTVKPARFACRRLAQPAVGPRKRDTARGTTQSHSPYWAIGNGPTSTHRRGDEWESTVKTAHPAWRPLQNTSGWPQQEGHSPRLHENSIARRGGRSRSGPHPPAGWRASLLKGAPKIKNTKGGSGGRNNERGWRRGKENQARRGWRNESWRRRSDGADTVTARARRRWSAAATGRGGPWMQCVLRLCSPEGTVSAAATRAVAPSHTGYMRYPDLGTAWRARRSI